MLKFLCKITVMRPARYYHWRQRARNPSGWAAGGGMTGAAGDGMTGAAGDGMTGPCEIKPDGGGR